ncbi:MAG: tRNA (N(6)-L-threonylcarbamoyladenosine(37)-C(2))-methylthiotransferase MtaB [Planctomycetota bacterium]|jgi:threonylcarbamoyladenosine tRNA methylthiotransferase MtaB
MSAPTFTLVTFGCKVNQYESQALREDLVRRGYREAPAGEAPSLFIINTCTVTETASSEGRRWFRRLQRRNPGSRMVVTGCAVETDRDAFNGGALVVPQKEKAAIGGLLTGTATDTFTVSRFDGHTRAFLKIEDGCDLNCSFCIIPRVRGPVASRPIADAVDEAKRLVDNGHAEIVLTGIHVGAYGKDLARRSLLPDLVERMLEIRGLARVRLSSIEANEIEDALVGLMAAEPRRFCPHLHVPLQSGDDAILGAMRRRYTVRGFLEACARVAERVPCPSFTTDVIAGFPGETEERFERTVDVCRRVGMSRIHIFPYSPRRGTDAARMEDGVPGREKKRRLRRLREVAGGLTAAFAEKFAGREVDVLVEREDGSGYTERYLKARAPGAPRGALVTGRAVRSGGVLEVRP